jgi:hypothetical protein
MFNDRWFYVGGFFRCPKGKKNWVEHIILYKTHMQVENLNKME